MRIQSVNGAPRVPNGFVINLLTRSIDSAVCASRSRMECSQNDHTASRDIYTSRQGASIGWVCDSAILSQER